MAILNVTPDSFYAASRADADKVVERAAQLVDDGADMVDVGGYSTRPDAAEVAPEEELRRVLAGVDAVRRCSSVIPISIDTFRAEVAEEVLKRFDGVTVNDISAGEGDPRMVEVAAHYRVPMIAMHKRGTPQTMQTLTDYDDVVAEVTDYLARRAEALHKAGVVEVILDPGFGFAKTAEQNFELLAGLDRVTALGLPVLVGISRKSFIYKTLNITPEESLTATQTLHWECLAKGASVLRTHDPLATRRTIELFEKTMQYEKRDD